MPQTAAGHRDGSSLWGSSGKRPRNSRLLDDVAMKLESVYLALGRHIPYVLREATPFITDLLHQHGQKG